MKLIFLKDSFTKNMELKFNALQKCVLSLKISFKEVSPEFRIRDVKTVHRQ